MKDFFIIYCLIVFVVLGTYKVTYGTNPEVVPPVAVLEKIAHCPEISDYTGTFTLEFKGEQQPYFIINHIMHRHPDITRIVCLAPPERAGNIVYIYNTDIYIKKKPSDSLFHKRSEYFPQRFSVEKENIDLILKNYTVTVAKDSIYCKKPISIIKIVPLDSTRPSYIVSVDKKFGLILKLEKYRRQTEKIFGFRFTEINFSPLLSPESIQMPAEDAIKKDAQYERFPNEQALAKAFGQELVLPAFLPTGFKIHQCRLIKHSDEAIAHIVYTDGVTNLSFFIRLLRDKERPKTGDKEYVIQGRDDMNIIRGKNGKFYVSCIGDLTKDVLIKVFSSVK